MGTSPSLRSVYCYSCEVVSRDINIKVILIWRKFTLHCHMTLYLWYNIYLPVLVNSTSNQTTPIFVYEKIIFIYTIFRCCQINQTLL